MDKTTWKALCILLGLSLIFSLVDLLCIVDLKTKQKQQYKLIQELALNDAEFNKLLRRGRPDGR